MGAVDLSLSGTGIVNSLGITSSIPNWSIYAAGGAVIVMLMMSEGHRRHRR